VPTFAGNMLRALKVLVLLLVVVHFATLTKSPVPWFDETYFASLCKSLAEGKGFNADVCPLMEAHYPQAKAYGPGYLFPNALIIKVFGLGIFQNRILALLAGFGALGVWYVLARSMGISLMVSMAGVVALLCDSVFMQGLHSGRMDTLAVLCMLTAVYFSHKLTQSADYKTNFWWKNALLAGLSSGYCLLTSPRPAIILVGFWLGFFLVRLWESRFKVMGQMFIIGGVSAFMYLVWIYTGFSGIQAWLNYFFAPSADPINKEMNTLVSMYMGKRGYVPTYQWIIILPAIFTLPFAWRAWSKSLLIGLLLSLCSFYLLIIDTGMYSVLVLPFWMLLLAFNLSIIADKVSGRNGKLKWVVHSSMPALALLLLVGFMIKMVFVVVTYPERNQTTLQQFFEQHLPKGSKVIGEDKYYYGVLKSGSDFQYLMRGSHGERRRKYHFDEYGFDYLIASAVDEPNLNWSKSYYGEWAEWQEVARYDPGTDRSSIKQKIIDLYLSRFPTLSYSTEGVLYKRVDKPRKQSN
jgi:hypothetical protein